MGLGPNEIRLLVKEHKRRPVRGPVLFLGRQHIRATIEDVVQIIESEGLTPAPLPPGYSEQTHMLEWWDTPQENCIHDHVLFWLLGVKEEILSLDVSSFQGAEIVHDLNLPVPQELFGRFGFIYDSGTLEHVFDVKAALANVVRMLKPGGRVLHELPVNNFVNHGYHQFSPMLFFDYYRVNGFIDAHALLRILLDNANVERVAEYDGTVPMLCAHRIQISFLAEKTAESTVDVMPAQTDYVTKFWQ